MNGIKRSGKEAPSPDLRVGEYGKEIVITRFHLNSTVFEWQEQAVNELYQIASQCEDRRLRLGEVRVQLWAAGTRFTQALNQQHSQIIILETLADIVYWSVQQYAHDHLEHGLHLVGTCFAEPANFRLSQAYRASLAKYRLPHDAATSEVHKAIREVL
jgi:hypothetical protein